MPAESCDLCSTHIAPARSSLQEPTCYKLTIAFHKCIHNGYEHIRNTQVTHVTCRSAYSCIYWKFGQSDPDGGEHFNLHGHIDSNQPECLPPALVKARALGQFSQSTNHVSIL
jgi:hypothetical protein